MAQHVEGVPAPVNGDPLRETRSNMNPANPSQAANGQHSPPGFTADDAIFTLFRHKWLILAFVCLGLAGAVAVRFVKPPLYVSKAKLMVNFVLNTKDVTPATPDGPHAVPLDAGAQSILSAEVEILTSLDVAASVADTIGPAKILAKKGGGTDRMAAAGVICSGVEVDPPKSSILTISFKHPDPDIVQPVLEALLQAYALKHRDVRLIPIEDLLQQRDELHKKLAATDEELKTLKVGANIPFPEDANRAIQRQIGKIQDALLDVRQDLMERKAMLGDKAFAALGQTNRVELSVPADNLNTYGFVTTRLEELKRQLSELLLQYTEAYPLVQNIRDRIEKLKLQKADLERQNPGLTHVLVAGGQLGTNAVPTEVLIAREAALTSMLTNLQAQAARVMDVQPKIAELERRRTEEQRSYGAVINRIDEAQRDSGKQVNMSSVQSPTPPGLDYKKMMKLVGVVLAGCIGMGVGLAFLMDLFLDRSLKRSSEVERHLRLPVFLSIPDTAWAGWLRLPSWLTGLRRWKSSPRNGAGGNGGVRRNRALAPWDPAHQLRTYTEGLRERIISYFEVQNLNLKKPKLVGVTGCNRGAGYRLWPVGWRRPCPRRATATCCWWI